MPATNPFELSGRRRKADAIAISLEIATRHMTPAAALALVESMGDTPWNIAAQTAHVRTPSRATREVVIERFRRAAALAGSAA